MMITRGVYFLLKNSMLFLLFFSASAIGANENDTTEINVSGELIVPPKCTISSDKAISVDFGDNIIIQNIESGSYQKLIPYTVDCDDDEFGIWSVKIKMEGDAASFDSTGSTIRSQGQASLGVSIMMDGHPLPLNQWVRINDKNSPPQLQAVLSMQSGAVIEEGIFTASGILWAEYQ